MRVLSAALVLTCLALHAQADVVVSNSATATTSIPVFKQDPEVVRQNRLDSLLGRLHEAPKTENTAAIDQEVREIWARNRSATAEVLLQESSVAIAEGAYEPAEQMLSQLLETYPTFAEGWARRAYLYHLTGRPDAALIDIDHALEIEPRDYISYALKGIILVDLKRTDDALAALHQSLAINPNLPAVEAGIKKIEKEEPHV